MNPLFAPVIGTHSIDIGLKAELSQTLKSCSFPLTTLSDFDNTRNDALQLTISDRSVNCALEAIS